VNAHDHPLRGGRLTVADGAVPTAGWVPIDIHALLGRLSPARPAAPAQVGGRPEQAPRAGLKPVGTGRGGPPPRAIPDEDIIVVGHPPTPGAARGPRYEARPLLVAVLLGVFAGSAIHGLREATKRIVEIPVSLDSRNIIT
jgi:hypothetical protein